MSVTPASINFYLYQGATFSEPVTLNNSAGTPINLTGYSAKLMARRDISDAAPVFSLDSTAGGILLGGTAGTITLAMSASATAALTIDWDGEFWVHDLLLTDGTGNVQRTYQGVIVASPGVTR